MAKLILLLVCTLVVAVTWAQADRVDPGYERPPPMDKGFGRPEGRRPPMRRPRPPPGMGGFVGAMMRQLKGVVMDFIGAELYGERVFMKMTVVLTPDEQKKYSDCAMAAMEKIKPRAPELEPIEKRMLLERVLGSCIVKAKYNYDDAKVEKLECCTMMAYFNSMMSGGHKGAPRAPPGFRMIEAEFGCFMNMTYGFSIEDLKAMQTCVMGKVGIKNEGELEKKFKNLLGLLDGEEELDDEAEGRRPPKMPKMPTQQDLEDCMMQAKPSMKQADAKTVAFLNTKKRELAVETQAQSAVDRVKTAKRLLALLENLKN